MAKLKLIANPTFKAKVPIPVAGGESVGVEMTFKHRTKSGLEEWLKAPREDKSDTDIFLEMVEAWDLEDPFNRENVELLLENYMGSAVATHRTYIDQLIQAKLGN
jgi:Domain of unknown function (DUF1789).